MAYKVIINTNSYKDRRCSEKNWEPGTMNNFMHSINGWSIREGNLRDLKWRLYYIAGSGACGVDNETWPIYQEWELVLASRVTLGKLLNVSKPQFP